MHAVVFWAVKRNFIFVVACHLTFRQGGTGPTEIQWLDRLLLNVVCSHDRPKRANTEDTTTQIVHPRWYEKDPCIFQRLVSLTTAVVHQLLLLSSSLLLFTFAPTSQQTSLRWLFWTFASQWFSKTFCFKTKQCIGPRQKRAGWDWSKLMPAFQVPRLAGPSVAGK